METQIPPAPQTEGINQIKQVLRYQINQLSANENKWVIYDKIIETIDEAYSVGWKHGIKHEGDGIPRFTAYRAWLLNIINLLKSHNISISRQTFDSVVRNAVTKAYQLGYQLGIRHSARQTSQTKTPKSKSRGTLVSLLNNDTNNKQERNKSKNS